VIVDHDNQRVLDVLENRDKATVYAYLEQGRKGGLLRHVEEVTIDMWSAYEGAVREAFGSGVTITIDRFHVMKNFQECLTKGTGQKLVEQSWFGIDGVIPFAVKRILFNPNSRQLLVGYFDPSFVSVGI